MGTRREKLRKRGRQEGDTKKRVTMRRREDWKKGKEREKLTKKRRIEENVEGIS